MKIHLYVGTRNILYFYLFALFIYLFFIVVQIQLSPFSPHHDAPPHPFSPPTIELTLFGFLHMSFIHVPWWPPTLSPIIPISPSFWLLSDCSLFQCLWFYFACLFVLLIRFHLKVRSYGISLSPLALFHLA